MTRLTSIALPLAIAAVAAVSGYGCAGQQTGPEPTQETVRDFIDSQELPTEDRIRTSLPGDGFDRINDYYVVYEAARGTYLFELGRRCVELRDRSRVVPDKRTDANWIYARFDTLRGCPIAAIYGLNEAQAAEIRNLGQAPGERN